MRLKLILFIFFYIISLKLTYSKEIIIKVIDGELGLPLEGVKIQLSSTPYLYYTDSRGLVKIEINEKEKNPIIIATLPGYYEKKYLIKENEFELILKMYIRVIEGKELVIEKDVIGKKDEELGVSKVVNQNELSSTANKGAIEDVMNTVKVLPGVTYGGTFNVRLSVRGGHPDELTCMYDGFLIRFPYHWGGGFSIFNPDIIESFKFSTGIFNVKYGYAISGLIEIESVTPDKGIRFNSLLSMNNLELLLLSQLGKKSGLFIGTRLLYTEFAFMLVNYLKSVTPSLQDGISYPVAPNIRDVYFKWFLKPNERIEWIIDGFFASDAASFYYDPEKVYSSNNGIKTLLDYLYYNYDFVAFTKLKILPIDNLLISFLIGNELLYNGVKSKTVEYGEKKYSNEFKEYCINNGIVLTADSFKIKKLTSLTTSYILLNSIQSRVDFDFTLSEKIIFSTGVGLFYDITKKPTNGDIYQIIWEKGLPLYKNIRITINEEEKHALKSNLYINFSFNIIPQVLKLDLGARIDYVVYYMLVPFETLNYYSYHFTTYPVIGPRVNIIWTAIKEKGFLERLSFSFGAGIFSKIPSSEVNFTTDLKLKDFQINLPKAISTVIGTHFEFPLGFRFKLESYYKYYYDDFYVNTKIKENSIHYIVHSDGIGHVAGFDLIFERKSSRYIDGWVSYSFIFARFLKPQDDNLENPSSKPDEPRGIWYYPSYHRFHAFSFVLNIKPSSWCTITTVFTLATGVPKLLYKNKTMFASFLEDGTIVEMYAREAVYNDYLRTNISFPLDLRVSFNRYIAKSKVRYESYIAVDDILSFLKLYLPKDNVEIDKYTGEERIAAISNASLPFPIPSMGVRIGF